MRRRKNFQVRANDGFEIGEGRLRIGDVLARETRNLSEIALCADPIGKGGLAAFVGELIRLEGLPRLRHELIAKQPDVVLGGLDPLQRVAQ
jgi:hypothetical protein